MTVLQRLTDAGINMVTKIGSSINAIGNQIKSGGLARAMNLEQANFLLEGLHANVKKVMEDVNWAVEGTAYGLDEAAKSAAVFYAAGIKPGKQMATALRAISGVAAMTGKSYSDMADVFQDAAGMGKVMRNEILRLQQQGLAADQYLLKFMNRVVDSGGKLKGVSKSVNDEVMELTKGSKLSLEDLTEPKKGLLAQGAISFNVFAAAMDKAFGKHAQDANKTFSGSLANVKTALSRLGEAFISPGMKAMIPLLNRLREGISAFTGTIKELVVPGYTEWITNLGKGMAKLVNRMNKLMIFAELSRTVTNGIRMLGAVLTAVKDEFQEAFPDVSIKNMGVLVHNIADLSAKFYDAHKGLEGFHKVLHIFFSLISTAWNILSGFVKIVKSIISVFTDLDFTAGTLLDTFVSLADGLNSKSGATKIFDVLAHTVENAGSLIKKATHTIIDAFMDLVKYVGQAISDIDNIDEAIAAIGLMWGALFAQKTIRKAMSWSNRLFKILKNVLRFFDTTEDQFGVVGLTTHINDILGNTTRMLKQMTLEVNAKVLQKIAVAILALAIALKILADIDAMDLATGLAVITLFLTEMQFALKQLIDIMNTKADMALKNIWAFGTLTNALIKLSIALLAMVIALKILASMKLEELAKGLAAFEILMGTLFGFIIGLSKLMKKYMAADISQAATSMIAIAVAIDLLVIAVKKLSEMNVIELGKGLGSIVVLLGSIMGFIIGITRLSDTGGAGMVAAGAGMVLIAAAINILVPALRELGKMDMEQLANGIGSVAASLIIMGIASNIINLQGSAGILAMSVGMLLLANAIDKIAKYDIKTLAISLGALTAAMLAMVGVGALAGLVAGGLLAMSAAMLAMSVSVTLLGVGLIAIGSGLAIIAGGIMTFASLSQTAIMSFVATIKFLLQQLITIIPTIAAMVATAFVEFIESIAELAPRLKEAFTSIITTIIEAFLENVPRIIVVGINFIKWFLQGLAEEIPEIAKSAAMIIAGFIEGIAQGMAAIITAGIDLMLAFINGLAEGIRAHKNDIKNAVLNLCKAILEAFMSFFGIASPSKVMATQGKNLILGLVNGIKNSAGKVKTALINAVKNGLNAIKNAAKNFLSAGTTLITNLVKGVRTKIGELASSVKEGVSKAASAVKNTVSDFISAGKSVVSGIATGIRNGVSSVISAVGSIASRALSHFKSKLGINSPSKEFAKLGAGIPEGTVKGINGASRLVGKAVDRMGSSAISRMRKVLSDLGDTVSVDADFNPTITPVLDLSNIEKESSRINGLLAPDTLEASYSAANNANISQNSRMMFIMDELLKAINDSARNSGQPNVVNVTNNVSGSENPEHFANRFVRQLQLEMRTG